MFQYAAGRRAAYVNKTNLKLDITGYKNQEGITLRKYMLHIFNINGDFATLDEIQKLKGSRSDFLTRYFTKLTKRIVPHYKQSYIKQRYFHFAPNILKISDNTYLEGYWASEKYFQDIEDIIRKEFTFKEGPDKQNKKIINQIKKLESVSIHFRRSDYVFDKKTHDYHGVCDLDYYNKAVCIMAKKIANPLFFIFSDDPKWVKQNLHLKYPTTIVDYNFRKKDYEDLRLMSLCKHNIIANSSFSWWGAWLNKNPDKIVIAPKKWFNDPLIDTKDLIPDSWTRS